MHTNGEAAAAFRDYAEAFRSLDPKAVARHFNEPALLITPQGIDALASAADVERAYARIMADLPALGYADTVFSSVEERRLGDDLALVTGGGTWRKATGEEFLPFGMTYTLRRADGRWRIVVAAIHARQTDG